LEPRKKDANIFRISTNQTTFIIFTEFSQYFVDVLDISNNITIYQLFLNLAY